MFLKATFALTAMIWTYTMLDNVLVGKFFNKKYDMNLLHKKDKMLGQSKKLGKGDFDLLIPFPMMRQKKIIRYINWKDHVQEFKEQTVFTV